MSRLEEYVAASDPARLTWALFDLPSEVHAINGRFVAGTVPSWPADHKQDVSCPCRPTVVWNSAAAPRPLYEHHPTPGAARPQEDVRT